MKRLHRRLAHLAIRCPAGSNLPLDLRQDVTKQRNLVLHSQENLVSHFGTTGGNGLAVHVRMGGQGTACCRCLCSTKVSLAFEYCLQVGGRSLMVSETSFCSIAAPGNRFQPLLSWLEVDCATCSCAQLDKRRCCLST